MDFFTKNLEILGSLYSPMYELTSILNTEDYDFENSEESYKVHIKACGVKKSDIDIQFQNKKLNVTIDFSNSKFTKNKETYSKILSDVDVNKITASLSNGILTIVLMKKEKVKPIKIKIE